MKSTRAKHDEATLYHAIAEKYAGDEWLVLRQVRNSTGSSGQIRYADALAINCYPSRGFPLHGFEIKSHRSDWLKELDNANKAETSVWRFCTCWWIVAADKTVVKKSELPVTWGLLYLQDGKLKVAKRAPTNDKAQEPTVGFLASCLRAAIKQHTNKADTDKLLQARWRDGYNKGRQAPNTDLNTKVLRTSYENLRKTVDTFCKASGVVQLSSWNAGNIGAAVRFVLDHDLQAVLQQSHKELTRQRKVMDRHLEIVQKALDRIEPHENKN